MSSVSEFSPRHLIKQDERVNEQHQNQDSQSGPLALPAPKDAEAVDSFNVDQDDSFIRFDHLGPIVVNTNGTLSRIHNWHTLSEAEKSTTLRVLAKRNKSRMEAIKAQEAPANNKGASTVEEEQQQEHVECL